MAKTLTDMFEEYKGAKEWDSTVNSIMKWYYGSAVHVAWCAVSMSYMANKLGILDQFGGKNQNCYEMLNAVKTAVKKTGKGKVYDKDQLKGRTIKRGTVIFVLNDDPPMKVGSKKHVTTCYKDFVYKGTGTYQNLGGNQNDAICVKTNAQSRIWAIFEPDYDKYKALRKGDKGPEVGELQKCLNYFGYRDKDGKALKIDNSFGSHTEYALKAFQKDQGLKVDGVCGPATQGKIESLEKAVYRVTANTNVWCRKTPEVKDGNKIRVLQKGHQFIVSRVKGDWSYIPNEGGWSMSKYLEK